MSRPALEVADIFRDHGAAWRRANAGHVSLDQMKVMSAIERCRTAALGGHVARCEDCAHTVIAYNSCRNRHCPKCQGAAATAMARRARGRAAAGALLPRRVHAAGGHRRHRLSEQGRDLRPPVHGLGRDHAHHRGRPQASRRPHRHHRGAAHLGLGDDAPSARAHDRAGRRHLADGSRWVSCRPNFFLPVRVLSRLFRRLFLAKLRAAHQAGRLKFFGDHAHLDDARAFTAYLAPLRKIEWVVYAKKPFGGPQAVLAYLSRYTHRVAISNRRLISADETGVTFKWKDYRIEGPGRYKTMTLATHEFIRRFLIHVLPKGFHRIRHYGLLANGNRAANIARARELLAVPSRSEQPEHVRSRSARRTARAAASMSVLRWPHDHHRDLRARLRAEAPPRAYSSSNQDRHLMMPSPPIDNSYHPCHPCWLSAGSDRTRIRPRNWPVSAPPIPSRNVPTARSPRRAHPGFAATRPRAAASAQPL